MLEFVKRYGRNVYSQNDEDGIIQECLRRMKIKEGVCAEFGAADGKFCSNTYNLLQQGWRGIMIEPNHELFNKLITNTAKVICTCLCKNMFPDTINQILPLDLDLLSVDTDSKNDYNCWYAYEGTPKVVIIEINSSKDPLTPYLDEGASYITMYKLGIAKGYFLLCHTGNLIFLRNEYRNLFPELDGTNPIIDVELYFNKKWL